MPQWPRVHSSTHTAVDPQLHSCVTRRAALAPTPDTAAPHKPEIAQGWPKLWANFRGSNRDFHSKCWAKSRNLGQPYAIFVHRSSPRREASAMAMSPRMSSPRMSSPGARRPLWPFCPSVSCVVGRGRVSLFTDLDTWHSKPYLAVPGIVQRCTLCRTVPYRTVPCRAAPCRAVPHRAVPCRTVPCRAAPCLRAAAWGVTHRSQPGAVPRASSY
jgi:hypothetical protein